MQSFRERDAARAHFAADESAVAVSFWFSLGQFLQFAFSRLIGAAK
jgi:hypothetical protein